eukprot:TRINITY_DN1242_c3_g1_i2.p1 TRINITY_DN1242_c3_g1~~TRINITY_DN1242_c3_g1_i2.p1  ORF type:complete len:131 (-),score=58.59 TRINITY_DN1242_c3_g1_i2:102-461(-)
MFIGVGGGISLIITSFAGVVIGYRFLFNRKEEQDFSRKRHRVLHGHEDPFTVIAATSNQGFDGFMEQAGLPDPTNRASADARAVYAADSKVAAGTAGTRGSNLSFDSSEDTDSYSSYTY